MDATVKKITLKPIQKYLVCFLFGWSCMWQGRSLWEQLEMEWFWWRLREWEGKNSNGLRNRMLPCSVLCSTAIHRQLFLHCLHGEKMGTRGGQFLKTFTNHKYTVRRSLRLLPKWCFFVNLFSGHTFLPYICLNLCCNFLWVLLAVQQRQPSNSRGWCSGRNELQWPLLPRASYSATGYPRDPDNSVLYIWECKQMLPVKLEQKVGSM